MHAEAPCMHACMLTHFSQVWLFAILWTVACQAPLSMGFSRQKYWSGLPSPPLGDLPQPRVKPVSTMSPALAGGFFITSTTWKAQKPSLHHQTGYTCKIPLSQRTRGKGLSEKCMWCDEEEYKFLEAPLEKYHCGSTYGEQNIHSQFFHPAQLSSCWDSDRRVGTAPLNLSQFFYPMFNNGPFLMPPAGKKKKIPFFCNKRWMHTSLLKCKFYVTVEPSKGNDDLNKW